MKRQTQIVRSMVYQSGTVPARVAPVVGEEQALTQMKLGKRLWNVLVTIDRFRVAAYRRIMSDEVQQDIDKLRARKDEIWAEIKALRKKARARVPVPPELEAERARIKAALAMLLEQQNATKKARHDARRAELDRLTERTNRRIKKARQAAGHLGLYWGTYNAVIENADAARKHGGELRYRGFRGEGTLTAQIIGGASPAECVEGSHTFFQLAPQEPDRKWRYARVRIGSTQDRSAVWVQIPIVYHREIPPEARIKTVSATRRIVAGKVRWSLQVTVTLPPVEPKPAGAAIACDIGWRLLPGGVRVAYWQDDRGRHGDVKVADSDIRAFQKVADLRSICDQSRNEFLPTLVAWLATQTLDGEWTARTRALAQWRNTDRLAGLVRWWSDHRLTGDDEIHTTAVAWRSRYLHLANWWRNQQDQMTLRVREQYRRFASRIAANYSVLILEDFDLRPVVKSADQEQKPVAGNYRQMVSPSVFRDALLNACRREGMEIRIVPAAYTTSACHSCQHVEVFDHVNEIIHRCGACSALWDQDHNAAINLLASGKAASTKNQQDSPGILPVPGDRSQSQGKEAMGSAD